MSEDLSALNDAELKAKRDAFGQIKVGSIVKLKSGGPELTVEAIDGDVLNVMWFMGASLQRATFASMFLQHELTNAEKAYASAIMNEMLGRVRKLAERNGLRPREAWDRSGFLLMEDVA